MNFLSLFDFDTPISENITIYAKWEAAFSASGDSGDTGIGTTERILLWGTASVIVIGGAGLAGIIIYYKKKEKQ